MGALEPSLEAEIRVRLADCYRDLDDPEASYRALGPVLDDPPDSTWRARALIRLARVFYFRADPDAARAASVDAVELLAATSEHTDYAQAQLWLSHSLRMLGDSEGARSALRSAVASARRGGSAWLEAGGLSALGHLEIRSARLRDAEHALSAALAVDVEAGHRRGISKIHLHLAVCRLHAGNWVGFEESLEGAVRAYRELGDRKGLAMAATLRARGERLRGRDGGRWLDEAEELAAPSAYVRARIQVAEERGYVLLDREEFHGAAHLFGEILERGRVEEVGEDMTVDALGGLARALVGLGRRDEAAERAIEAVRVATKAGDLLAAASADITLGLVREDPEPIEASIAVLSAGGARCELLRAHRAAVRVLGRSPARAWHLQQQARLARELGLVESGTASVERTADDVTNLAGMTDVMNRARQLVGFEGGILLTGERGVGRTNVAEEIHRWSRRPGPLVRLHCGAASRDQIFRELHGEPGLGDGALARARNGTLLLEGIDELTAEAQGIVAGGLDAALEASPSPSAVLATAGADLAERVRSGAFRRDLYARVAALTLDVPPLRDRPGDAVAVAAAWAGRSLGKEVRTLLLSHDWPGNLAELREAVRAALHLANGAPLAPEHFPEVMRRSPGRPGLRSMIDELETREIRRALEVARGNKTRAAKALGISRKGMFDRLKRLGLWEE